MGANGRRDRSGLTLIEALVVVAVIGLLAGLLMVAVQSSRELARRMTCQDRLRQIGLAVQSHESARGALPALYNGTFLPMPRSALDEFHFHSWRTAILPQLDQSALASTLVPSDPITLPSNQTAVNVELAVFLCPSTANVDANLPELFEWNDGAPPIRTVGSAARNDYEVIGGVQLRPQTTVSSDLSPIRFGAWGEPTYRISDGASLRYRTARFADITDGLSQTMLIGERAGRPDLYDRGRVDPYPYADPSLGGDPHQAAWAVSTHIAWTVFYHKQSVNETNRIGIFSFHPGGANVAFADGSVRFLKQSTDPATLAAMATRSGAEVFGSE